MTTSGGRVIKLALSNNSLHGSLPAAIGNLTALEELYLGFNRGTRNLRKLVELNLSENELTGSIPSSFNNFRSVMTRLYLSHNQLSGSIPLYLLNFSELDTLHLSFNNFTGCMPNGLRRAINHHGFGGISLEPCTNALTNTPVPTNTLAPTATPDPLTPTATPAPGFSEFTLSGRHQSIRVDFGTEKQYQGLLAPSGSVIVSG